MTIHHPGLEPFDVRCLSVLKVLPAGEAENGGWRDELLVQIYTDPGGIRTLALRSILKVR